jgi:hypothetical protein
VALCKAPLKIGFLAALCNKNRIFSGTLQSTTKNVIFSGTLQSDTKNPFLAALYKMLAIAHT